MLDKMALFWHGIFATGVPKVINGWVLYDQINTFRRHGMDGFDSILLRLAKDPAMIVWLDNQGQPRRRDQRELGPRATRAILDGSR